MEASLLVYFLQIVHKHAASGEKAQKDIEMSYLGSNQKNWV